MSPTPESTSNMAHQSPEFSFQVPALPTNSVPTVNPHIFVDAEGRPLSIYVSRSVPDYKGVEEIIKEYGGIPVEDENKATIKLGPPGRDTQEVMFSSQWVHDCLKDKVCHAHDTFAYRLGTGNRISKSYFSRDDDILLEEFIASKKAEGAFLNGNKIYEELAEMHKQHSAQSWRDRAIKSNLTSKPPPYELGKAKREEARRRQQEKLTADKLMLEVAQRRLLGQRSQATQHDKLECEQKSHSPPKPEQRSQQLPVLASNTTQLSYQIVNNDSDEGVKQESPQRPSHHLPKSQQSQQSVLVFSDIESTDEEDRFHKDERNAIASRRSNSSSRMSAPKLSASQTKDKNITPSQPIPNIFSALIQDVPASVNRQDEHIMDDSQGPSIASDTQEVATAENTKDDSLTKDLQGASADKEAQDEPAVGDWQDEPVVDDLCNELAAQESADGLDQARPFQASVSDKELTGDLTDEDDIIIVQRILGKKQAQHLSPLVSREQRSSSPIPTSSRKAMPKMQEVRDSDDDQAYELPSKLLSRTPAQRHQTPWSQTVWSTGMSFQFKKMPAADRSREGSEVTAELSAVSRDASGPVLDSDSEGSQEERPGSVAPKFSSREGSESDAELSVASSDVSGPVSRDVSIFNSDGEGSQDESIGSAIGSVPRSPKIDTSMEISMEISMTNTQTVVETSVAGECGGSLSGEESEYKAVVGKSEDVIHPEQEKEKERDGREDKIDQQTNDVVDSGHERAHVSSTVESCVIPEPGVEQDSREVSVLSSMSKSKDVLLDYYLGEGDNESLEKRLEREQLLLYLRDHYRKEIRTLMLHELVPALRSIDVLDACSGDFAIARALISKGMTEENETYFWTREDDCKLFSSKDEDVKGLLERHSAVELIQRTRYLTRTREEAKRFEVAPDAMEKSGLLKRARGRFGGRDNKRQRLDDDES
ncbi:hypothetical protein EC991_008719 [Linnemannia zychae]|nr:hypothetical protein EC991_008719 [Linnemannia zychae]